MRKYISIILLFLLMTQNSYALINPLLNNESILDIGAKEDIPNPGAEYTKILKEIPALYKIIDNIIETQVRDFTTEDCISDEFGHESCQIDKVECEATDIYNSGSSEKHSASIYTDKEGGEVYYPTNTKAFKYGIASVWTSFLKSYGVANGNYHFDFYAPENGTYKIKFNVDNCGYIEIDGSSKHSSACTFFAIFNIVSYNQYLSKGMHDIHISTSGDHVTDGVAATISFNNKTLWTIKNGQHTINYFCPDGFYDPTNDPANPGQCKKDYYFYTYTCPSDLDEWGMAWKGPLVSTGGDCQGIGIEESKGGVCPTQESIPPEKNCLRYEQHCPFGEDIECMQVSKDESYNEENVINDKIYKIADSQKYTSKISESLQCPFVEGAEENCPPGWTKNEHKCYLEATDFKLAEEDNYGLYFDSKYFKNVSFATEVLKEGDKYSYVTGTTTNLDYELNTCVADSIKICSDPAYEYNEELGACIIKPTCEDEIDGVCVQKPIKECPLGMNYNLNTKKCEELTSCEWGDKTYSYVDKKINEFCAEKNINNETVTCSEGFTLIGTSCIAMSTTKKDSLCAEGYTLNGDTCEKTTIETSTPICPSGTTLSEGICTGKEKKYSKATKTSKSVCPTGYDPWAWGLCIKWGVGFAWPVTVYEYSCSTGVLEGTQCVTTTSISEEPNCSNGELKDGVCVLETVDTLSPYCNEGILSDENTKCEIAENTTEEPKCVKGTWDSSLKACIEDTICENGEKTTLENGSAVCQSELEFGCGPEEGKTLKYSVTDTNINYFNTPEDYNVGVCEQINVCKEDEKSVELDGQQYCMRENVLTSCPKGYDILESKDKCVALPSCNKGFVKVGNECQITYNWYEYSCPEDWSGPNEIFEEMGYKSGGDCHGSCEEMNCDCNSPIAPANSCYKEVSDNYEHYILTKRPLMYHNISGTTLSIGEMNNLRNLKCAENIKDCYEGVNKITGEGNNLCFYKKNGESSCFSIAGCYFNGEIESKDSLITNIKLVDPYTMISDNVDTQNNSISSSCKINGHVGWSDRSGPIVSVGNSSIVGKNIDFQVTGSVDYKDGTTWAGFNAATMALHFSDGNWYVISTVTDKMGNIVNIDLPSFVKKLSNSNYTITNNSLTCKYKGINLDSNLCGAEIKILSPGTQLYVTEIMDIDSLRELYVNEDFSEATDNYTNLTFKFGNEKTVLVQKSGVWDKTVKVDASYTTDKIDESFLIANDRIRFWDSYLDGYIGSLEFVREVSPADREEGFVPEFFDYEELLGDGFTSIFLIDEKDGFLTEEEMLNNGVTYAVRMRETSNESCEAYALKYSGSVVNNSSFNVPEKEVLTNSLGLKDAQCIISMYGVKTPSNSRNAVKIESYSGDVEYICSPFSCVDNKCSKAECKEGYIGTYLPERFLPENSDSCMDQVCDANKDFVRYCGKNGGCPDSENVITMDSGECAEFYCEEGTLTKDNKCQIEACPDTTELIDGNCVPVK